MPRLYELWVVDEDKLPDTRQGSDRECFDAIVDAVKQRGARWVSLEASELPFMEALQRIDKVALGDHRFLPVLTYNHAPHDLLGPSPDCPDLGYFNPERVRDLHEVIAKTPKSIMAALADDPLVDRVFHAFKEAAREAADRGHAIAVLHGG